MEAAMGLRKERGGSTTHWKHAAREERIGQNPFAPVGRLTQPIDTRNAPINHSLEKVIDR